MPSIYPELNGSDVVRDSDEGDYENLGVENDAHRFERDQFFVPYDLINMSSLPDNRIKINILIRKKRNNKRDKKCPILFSTVLYSIIRISF